MEEDQLKYPEHFVEIPDDENDIEATPIPYGCVEDFLYRNDGFDKSSAALEQYLKYERELEAISTQLHSDIIKDKLVLTCIENLGTSIPENDPLVYVERFLPAYHKLLDDQNKRNEVTGELKELISRMESGAE